MTRTNNSGGILGGLSNGMVRWLLGLDLNLGFDFEAPTNTQSGHRWRSRIERCRSSCI